jgi:membrane-associated phospholipid phosphatase
MPLFFLFALALTVGLMAGLMVWRYPRAPGAVTDPTRAAAQEVGKAVGRHPRLRSVLHARLDATTATGLAMTIALATAIVGGVVLGVLAYLVRTNDSLIDIDNSVARWGNRHASAFSMHALNVVTQLGSIYTIVVLSVVLAVVVTRRERTIWVAAFIVAVVAGQEVITLTVKALVDRLRPTFNPAAATLGPSFPSGHSAAAAAFYACAALVLGRHAGRAARAVLTGLAVGIAVAVAASRVLLDVHWLSDVIGGLALGWGWFAVCAIAFGGRILRFGATAETAARVADATPADRDPAHADRSRSDSMARTNA